MPATLIFRAQGGLANGRNRIIVFIDLNELVTNSWSANLGSVKERLDVEERGIRLLHTKEKTAYVVFEAVSVYVVRP